MPGMGRGAIPPRGGYGGFRGGFAAGGPRAATCYKCGGPNHFARDCQAAAQKCYACGKLVSALKVNICLLYSFLTLQQGHISRDCTAPNGGPLNATGKTCYRCGQPGHISRDCTSAEVNGQVDSMPIDQVAPVVAPAAPTVA